MYVNKILLKTAYKNNHLSKIQSFLKLHSMSMGQHSLVILGHFLLINVVRKDY